MLCFGFHSFWLSWEIHNSRNVNSKILEEFVLIFQDLNVRKLFLIFMLTANIFSLYAVFLVHNFIKYFKMWKVSSYTDGGTEFMIHDLFLFGFFKKSPETVAVKKDLFSVFNQMKICRRTHLWQDDTRLLSWFSHVLVCNQMHCGLFYSASLLLRWILLFAFLGLFLCTIFSWRTVTFNQMMS